jgi:hypothetical protein
VDDWRECDWRDDGGDGTLFIGAAHIRGMEQEGLDSPLRSKECGPNLTRAQVQSNIRVGRCVARGQRNHHTTAEQEEFQSSSVVRRFLSSLKCTLAY